MIRNFAAHVVTCRVGIRFSGTGRRFGGGNFLAIGEDLLTKCEILFTRAGSPTLSPFVSAYPVAVVVTAHGRTFCSA